MDAHWVLAIVDGMGEVVFNRIEDDGNFLRCSHLSFVKFGVNRSEIAGSVPTPFVKVAPHPLVAWNINGGEIVEGGKMTIRKDRIIATATPGTELINEAIQAWKLVLPKAEPVAGKGAPVLAGDAAKAKLEEAAQGLREKLHVAQKA